MKKFNYKRNLMTKVFDMKFCLLRLSRIRQDKAKSLILRSKKSRRMRLLSLLLMMKNSLFLLMSH